MEVIGAIADRSLLKNLKIPRSSEKKQLQKHEMDLKAKAKTRSASPKVENVEIPSYQNSCYLISIFLKAKKKIS